MECLTRLALDTAIVCSHLCLLLGWELFFPFPLHAYPSSCHRWGVALQRRIPAAFTARCVPFNIPISWYYAELKLKLFRKAESGNVLNEIIAKWKIKNEDNGNSKNERKKTWRMSPDDWTEQNGTFLRCTSANSQLNALLSPAFICNGKNANFQTAKKKNRFTGNWNTHNDTTQDKRKYFGWPKVGEGMCQAGWHGRK